MGHLEAYILDDISHEPSIPLEYVKFLVGSMAFGEYRLMYHQKQNSDGAYDQACLWQMITIKNVAFDSIPRWWDGVAVPQYSWPLAASGAFGA